MKSKTICVVAVAQFSLLACNTTTTAPRSTIRSDAESPTQLCSQRSEPIMALDDEEGNNVEGTPSQETCVPVEEAGWFGKSANTGTHDTPDMRECYEDIADGYINKNPSSCKRAFGDNWANDLDRFLKDPKKAQEEAAFYGSKIESMKNNPPETGTTPLLQPDNQLGCVNQGGVLIPLMNDAVGSMVSNCVSSLGNMTQNQKQLTCLNRGGRLVALSYGIGCELGNSTISSIVSLDSL